MIITSQIEKLGRILVEQVINRIMVKVKKFSTDQKEHLFMSRNQISTYKYRSNLTAEKKNTWNETTEIAKTLDISKES